MHQRLLKIFLRPKGTGAVDRFNVSRRLYRTLNIYRGHMGKAAHDFVLQ
ncbi:MAG: hypothetical protein PVI90_08470 [Desulfobacteraceae bacterium]|jgi:hypothetical protein